MERPALFNSAPESRAIPYLDYSTVGLELEEQTSTSCEIGFSSYRLLRSGLKDMVNKYRGKFRGYFTGGLEVRADQEENLELDVWRFCEDGKPRGKARFSIKSEKRVGKDRAEVVRYYLNYSGNPMKFCERQNAPEHNGSSTINLAPVGLDSNGMTALLKNTLLILGEGLRRDLGRECFSEALTKKINDGDVVLHKLDLAFFMFPAIRTPEQENIFYLAARAAYGGVSYFHGRRLRRALVDMLKIRFEDLSSEHGNGLGFSLTKLARDEQTFANRTGSKAAPEMYRITVYSKSQEVEERDSEPAAARDLFMKSSMRHMPRVDVRLLYPYLLKLLNRGRPVKDKVSCFRVRDLDSILSLRNTPEERERARKLVSELLEGVGWSIIATPLDVDDILSKYEGQYKRELAAWKQESFDDRDWMNRNGERNAAWRGLLMRLDPSGTEDERGRKYERQRNAIRQDTKLDISISYRAYLTCWLNLEKALLTEEDTVAVARYLKEVHVLQDEVGRQQDIFNGILRISRSMKDHRHQRDGFLRAISVDRALPSEKAFQRELGAPINRAVSI